MSDSIDHEGAGLSARAKTLRAKADAQTAETRTLQNMADFLRVGGSVSWDRWESLGPASKRALVVASGVVARERAALLAAALREASKP